MKRHIIASVTDGVPVMKKFGRLNIEHQLCYAHGLQLAVCDVFYSQTPQRQNVLKVIRSSKILMKILVIVMSMIM